MHKLNLTLNIKLRYYSPNTRYTTCQNASVVKSEFLDLVQNIDNRAKMNALRSDLWDNLFDSSEFDIVSGVSGSIEVNPELLLHLNIQVDTRAHRYLKDDKFRKNLRQWTCYDWFPAYVLLNNYKLRSMNFNSVRLTQHIVCRLLQYMIDYPNHVSEDFNLENQVIGTSGFIDLPDHRFTFDPEKFEQMKTRAILL